MAVSRPFLEGERKLVTVLFCDVVDSTGLAERVGPEAMHSLLERFFDVAVREVQRCEGTVNQFLGDGFMALFGAPLAHEDHAYRAVLSAAAIRRAMGDAAAQGGRTPGPDMSVRMGINTGLVVIGKLGESLRLDYTAIGETTNLAARLQQLAEPGQIWLSESTYRAVRASAECEDLGEHLVKGKTQPVRVYRLRRVQPQPDRPPRRLFSPLVGRDVEVAATTVPMMRLQSGHGGALFVVGEAGVGKSRLVAEAKGHLSPAAVRVLEGRALPSGRGISLAPFIEIVRAFAGINSDDGNAAAWSKLERQTSELFADRAVEIAPYLATLLAIEVPDSLRDRVRFLDAEATGKQIFLSIRRLFERLAAQGPVLLILEDFHWVDRSSTEMVGHLLPLLETVPLLICVMGRPEERGPWAELRRYCADRHPARMTEIVVPPLGAQQTATLVQNLLSQTKLPAWIASSIVRKAEGNPFFVEEVVGSLVDMGAVSWDARTAQWRLSHDIEDVSVPDTVQGVIMARVDRLEEGLKEVLKTASVIGRSFLYRVIRAITEAGSDVDRRLGELVRVELLRVGRRAPEIEYLFRHPLVQEVTYDSMLSERRRLLHRLVGECVESLFSERLEEFYGLLAYHFSRAEIWEKAHVYLVKAGDQAGRLAGDTEALDHYRQAVAAYERVFGAHGDPLERAGLERRIGEALFRRGEHAEAVERLQRALESLGGTRVPESRLGIGLATGRAALRQVWHRMRAMGAATREADPRGLLVSKERVRIYRMLGWIDYFRDSRRLALDALLSLNVAEKADLADGVALGLSGMGIIFDQLSLRRLARAYHAKALPVAERIQHPVALGFVYLGLGWHRYSGADWSEAGRLFAAAANRFKEAGELREWGLATWSQDQVSLLQGRFRESELIVAELLKIGRDAGDKEVLGWGLQDRGILSVCREGATDEAIRALEDSIELLASVPDYLAVVCSRGYLGQCLLQRGEIGHALEVFRENRRLMAKYRVRGPCATPTMNGSAASHLAAAEQAGGSEKRRLLSLALRACREALGHAKSVPDGATGAYRLMGTYAWLASDVRGATRWWTRSVESGQRLGARYDLALTYLEMGRRLKDRASLTSAEATFGELDAPRPRADAAILLREHERLS